MERRQQGCLQGLLELFFLEQVFNWMEQRFGFGRGCSCSGCGCGIVMLVIFVVLACSIIFGTNWGSLFGS